MGIILIIAASILLFAFAPQLVRLFTDDAEVVKVGTVYIRIMTGIQWAYVMTFVHIAFLQAIKRPMYGFVESVIRKLILPVISFYIVVRVLNVELNQFWITMAVINIVMTVVTIIYAQSKLRRIVHR
jgi:Na+-driven multidrug efflux pump